MNVLKNLCYYDERNPNNPLDKEEQFEYHQKIHDDCLCDNCFKGKTTLAEYIIYLQDKLIETDIYLKEKVQELKKLQNDNT